jgi:hypothetical protein
VDEGDSGLVETPESEVQKPKSTRSRRPRTPRSDEGRPNPTEAAE